MISTTSTSRRASRARGLVALGAEPPLELLAFTHLDRSEVVLVQQGQADEQRADGRAVASVPRPVTAG
jgi:hypothetical protein